MLWSRKCMPNGRPLRVQKNADHVGAHQFPPFPFPVAALLWVAGSFVRWESILTELLSPIPCWQPNTLVVPARRRSRSHTESSTFLQIHQILRLPRKRPPTSHFDPRLPTFQQRAEDETVSDFPCLSHKTTFQTSKCPENTTPATKNGHSSKKTSTAR